MIFNIRRWVGLGSFIALMSFLSPVLAQPSSEWKVIDTRAGKEIRWRDLPGRLKNANAIFVGEQHDDPETHKAEAILLADMHQKVGDKLTLAMEMFERDGQSRLNDYLSGKIDEPDFVKSVRVWPNYATDYRPMIEFAKANKIPVLASNAPQKIVRKVGQGGLTASLASLSSEEKTQVASFILAPESDEYSKRFGGIISAGHGDGEQMEPTMIRRFYEAQRLRDDTMGETVARALRDGRTVFHVNGSFHSDAALGTASSVLWREPLLTRLAIVKIVPYKDKIDWAPLRQEADYLIFVPDRRPEKAK